MFIQSSWLCVNDTLIKLCKKQKQTYVWLLLISVPRFHSTCALELLGIINWWTCRKLWSLSFLHGNIFRDWRQLPNQTCSLTQELVWPRLAYPFLPPSNVREKTLGQKPSVMQDSWQYQSILPQAWCQVCIWIPQWTEWNHHVLTHSYCIYSYIYFGLIRSLLTHVTFAFGSKMCSSIADKLSTQIPDLFASYWQWYWSIWQLSVTI